MSLTYIGNTKNAPVILDDYSSIADALIAAMLDVSCAGGKGRGGVLLQDAAESGVRTVLPESTGLCSKSKHGVDAGACSGGMLSHDQGASIDHGRGPGATAARHI